MNIKRVLMTGFLMGLVIIAAGGLFAQKGKMIQIKGSDTLVNLVQILAEEYMDKNPGAMLAVMGGGSGTGISGLINQTCDIADHSREWKEKEFVQAREKGIQPRIFVIAVDGLSVIVHASNPVKKLTLAQLGAIYRGEITNWKAVGGPDKKISLYGRQSNSGTYVFMQEFVLGDRNYSKDMKEMNGNAQIIEGIAGDERGRRGDESGIGYVGVGYLYDASGQIRKGLKVVPIAKDDASPAFMPTDKAAVDSGDYPVARALYQSTNGKPSPAVAAFLKFEMSPEGQKIVAREGFFAISPKHIAENEKNLR
ncbi:MAG: PstS family phosphate ABC transporter substrate-binding protein [Candidatus Aminicenantes bacterium]|nr:PstS family phosphate ABC transporter substrate-binding protein [Candidatus Aminicenantes bacterium]